MQEKRLHSGKWKKKEGIEVAERLGHENSKKKHLLEAVPNIEHPQL
jgi:hypothetical protein